MVVIAVQERDKAVLPEEEGRRLQCFRAVFPRAFRIETLRRTIGAGCYINTDRWSGAHEAHRFRSLKVGYFPFSYYGSPFFLTKCRFIRWYFYLW